MTVKELIRQLKRFNPNLEVKVDSAEYSDFEIQKLNWYSSNFAKTTYFEEFLIFSDFNKSLRKKCKLKFKN